MSRPFSSKEFLNSRYLTKERDIKREIKRQTGKEIKEKERKNAETETKGKRWKEREIKKQRQGQREKTETKRKKVVGHVQGTISPTSN